MLVVCVYGYDINLIGGFECKEVVEVFNMDLECYVLVMIVFIGKVKNFGY